MPETAVNNIVADIYKLFALCSLQKLSIHSLQYI